MENDYEFSCSQSQSKEAAKEVSSKILPTESRKVYENVYINFIKWQAHKGFSSFSENELLEYFSELTEKVKPPTLWSQYSMLKNTLQMNSNVDISKYVKLISYIKQKSKGYIPKKSKIFTATQIHEFLNNAPDESYLMSKVALIFGIAGACQVKELCRILIDDVQDLGTYLIVKINQTRHGLSSRFIISEEYTSVYKKYIRLRPPHAKDRRLFYGYRNGRCINQVVGKNKFYKIPQMVAKFLNLKNPKLYTGLSIRRSAPIFHVEEKSVTAASALSEAVVSNLENLAGIEKVENFIDIEETSLHLNKEIKFLQSPMKNVDGTHFDISNAGECVSDNENIQEYNCRTCLTTVEKQCCTEVTRHCALGKTVKEALMLLVPKMFSRLKDSDVVCNDCFGVLESSIKFITKCLEIEGRCGVNYKVIKHEKSVSNGENFNSEVPVIDKNSIKTEPEDLYEPKLEYPLSPHCPSDYNVEVNKMNIIEPVLSNPKLIEQEYTSCKKKVKEKESWCPSCSERLIHLNVKLHKCSMCQKKFGKCEYLLRHMAIHTSRGYRIAESDKFGKRKNLKYRGIQIVNKKGELLPCKFCGKVISDRKRLKHHLSMHLTRHKCRFCPQTFFAKCQQTEHELIHKTKGSLFRCNISRNNVQNERRARETCSAGYT